MKLPSIATVVLPLAAASPFQHEKRDGDCLNDNVLRALRNPANTAGSFPFCKSLLGYSPVAYTSTKYLFTSTITVPVETSLFSSIHYVNPTNTRYTNMLHWSDSYDPPSPVPSTFTPTPRITTPATPSYVAQYFPTRVSSGCSCLLRPTSTPVTTVSSTTTTTFGRSTSHVSHIETYYEYQSAWVTYAEMCNPKILYRPFKTAAPSRAVATILPIPIKYQKVDCCQLCADTLNCMYWNYGPGGKCKIVYGTDQISDPSGPEICPNGLDYGGFTDQSTPYDMKNYFGAGPCSGGALYMSDEHYGDWCEESDWYCDDCNYYGGDSCK